MSLNGIYFSWKCLSVEPKTEAVPPSQGPSVHPSTIAFIGPGPIYQTRPQLLPVFDGFVSYISRFFGVIKVSGFGPHDFETLITEKFSSFYPSVCINFTSGCEKKCDIVKV
jgi:hypothetical protein